MTYCDSSSPRFVYEFLDSAGACLYIGCTWNLATRFHQHHTKPWWPDIARVVADLYPDEASGLAEERRRIEQKQPTHNAVYTESYLDRGGWAARRARLAMLHARGLNCQDTGCAPCRVDAHSKGERCTRGAWGRCKVCAPIKASA